MTCPESVAASGLHDVQEYVTLALPAIAFVSMPNILPMSDTELQQRVETLEIRLAHQEAAVDEMTRTLLEQERMLREQAETLRRLEAQLRASVPSLIASRDEETPPPHY